MVKRTGPENYQLQKFLIKAEEKALDSKLWKRIIEDLKKPTRQRRVVNIYKIDRFAREGETVVVPGKVLSVGQISKKVDVAALNFSTDARKKIEDAKGRTFSIEELFQQNPDGKKVRIIG